MFSFKRKKVKNLPPEILEKIFCEIINPNALLQCRRVCTQWKEIIDRLVLKRRIAIPYILHYGTIKHVDQRIKKKLKKSIGQNLLKNPFSKLQKHRLRLLNPSSSNYQLMIDSRVQHCDILFWETAGYFRLEKPSFGTGTTTEIPKHILRCWGLTSMIDLTVVASWGQGMIQSQTINLAQNNITDEIMDQIQPMIVVEMWIGNRFDYECTMAIYLTLLNRPYHPIADKFCLLHTPCSGSGAWRKVVVTMTNYGPGVRIIKFSRSGMETNDQYREGSEEFCGPKFAFNRISIELPKY